MISFSGFEESRAGSDIDDIVSVVEMCLVNEYGGLDYTDLSIKY